MGLISQGRVQEFRRRLSAFAMAALLLGAAGLSYAAEPASVLASAGGSAVALNFQPQPSASYASGATITVGVQAVDSNGQKVSSWSGTVTLSVTNNAAPLLGTTTLNVSGGKNQFHVSIDCAGSYTLTATDDAILNPLSPETSSQFVITGGVCQGSQTISFTSTAPATAVVGGPTYPVSATGGASGNPVTFTIDASASSVCAISGSTVSFTGLGTCVIDANQAGNTNYAAAPQAHQSFAVSAGSATTCSSWQNCHGNATDLNQGLFGSLYSPRGNAPTVYLTLGLNNTAADLGLGIYNTDCGVPTGAQLVGQEGNLQVFGNAPTDMQTTQVMIFHKAYLQSIGYASRNAAQFNVCLGAIYLPNPAATMLTNTGGNSGPWYGKDASGNEQPAQYAVDYTGTGRWWATAADCSASFIRARYDPCVGLKTKNGNQLRSYLSSLNFSDINSVMKFMGSGDLAIVVTKPYPWDGRGAFY